MGRRHIDALTDARHTNHTSEQAHALAQICKQAYTFTRAHKGTHTGSSHQIHADTVAYVNPLTDECTFIHIYRSTCTHTHADINTYHVIKDISFCSTIAPDYYAMPWKTSKYSILSKIAPNGTGKSLSSKCILQALLGPH